MSEPMTYGDLKHLLAAVPRGEWPSRVNPGLTHNQALDILTKGLATHGDDESLDSDRGARYKRNVLRECQTRTLAEHWAEEDEERHTEEGV